MKIFKAGEFADDTWLRLDDGDDVGSAQNVTVSLKRWQHDKTQLSDGGRSVGVWLEPGEEIDPELDGLEGLGAVVIPFEKFTDGRGYSVARTLRDAAKFTGEIRATGDVLIDQMPLMLRCGIDAFEVTHEPTLRALQEGKLPALPNIYQRPVAGGASLAGRHFSLKPTTPRAAE